MHLEDLYRVRPRRPWAGWGTTLMVSAVVVAGAARLAVSSSISARREPPRTSLAEAIVLVIDQVLDR
jgi:hypothetical protein